MQAVAFEDAAQRGVSLEAEAPHVRILDDNVDEPSPQWIAGEKTQTVGIDSHGNL